MRNTELSDFDRGVAEELKKLPEGTTTGARFNRAFMLGASPALLVQIAWSYVTHDPDDYHKITGLPYIWPLLAANWGKYRVREFLHTLCFNGEDTNYSHREGFWNDKSAWEVFTTAEQLREFLGQFAQHESRRILTPEGHAQLAKHFASLCADERQNQRDIRAVEAVAASHTFVVENEYQLGVMLRVAVTSNRRALASMATNVAAWGWSLVFRGYVLAKLRTQSYEATLIARGLYEHLDSAPEHAVQMYRWLVEGFWREHHEYWPFRLNDSHLRGIFSNNGWHFLPVTATPSGALQVVLPGKGERTIVRHVPGDEPLSAGDEVMISRAQLKNLTPSIQPGTKVYQLTLSPARRPTAAMLADVRGQFPVIGARKRRTSA